MFYVCTIVYHYKLSVIYLSKKFFWRNFCSNRLGQLVIMLTVVLLSCIEYHTHNAKLSSHKSITSNLWCRINHLKSINPASASTSPSYDLVKPWHYNCQWPCRQIQSYFSGSERFIHTRQTATRPSAVQNTQTA